MQTGALTSYFDVAQITLYAFWVFFAGLIFYLRSEDKREGYPLITDAKRRIRVQGFPPIPSPKTFLLADGSSVMSPRTEAPEIVGVRSTANWPGAPYAPTGNPMLDGVGPASYSRQQPDVPDHSFDDNRAKIVPLRTLPKYFVATEDPDPRGLPVVGGDGIEAATVVDVWVDRSEVVIRYVEVEILGREGAIRRLVPMNYVQFRDQQRLIRVGSIMSTQFATIPAHRNAETVTMLEEDKIMAYFGGGMLYATPARQEPLI